MLKNNVLYYLKYQRSVILNLPAILNCNEFDDCSAGVFVFS